MSKKVLVSIGEQELRIIDRAARRAGLTRSAYLRRAAIEEARRPPQRPIDDPAVRRAFEELMQLRKRMPPLSTAAALRARDRGRR